MGLLNRFFSSTETLARKIELEDELILKQWKDYLQNFSKKKKIISQLPGSSPQTDLKELKRLLSLELVDIQSEEFKEKELLADLESIEHSKKFKKVERLECRLGYVETKYEYVYSLLHEIYKTLKYQMHLVEKLLSGFLKNEKLISHLKQQLELESEVVNQIEMIQTFHSLFLAIVKGEHLIKTLSAKEKRFAQLMQNKVSKNISGELTKGLTYQWTKAVFDAVKVKVREGYADGIFDGPDADFEFVNQPDFVGLVMSIIKTLRKKPVSQQMINAFVHAFREEFNNLN